MKKSFILSLIVAFAMVGQIQAAQTGLWNFGGDYTAAVGTDGSASGQAASWAFDTTTNFGIADIGGLSTWVLKAGDVTDGSGIDLPSGFASANGGSTTTVNQYTIVADIYVENYSAGYLSVYSLDGTSASTVWINGSNGSMGGATPFGGNYMDVNFPEDTWVRVAMVTDVATGKFWYFADGVLLGHHSGSTDTKAINTVDGALSPAPLDPIKWFTHSSSVEVGDSYVSSVAVYDTVLTAAQIKTLGAATSAGIPSGDPAETKGLVLSADYGESSGDPVTYNDATFWDDHWASVIAYNGLGQLSMGHIDANWDDPVLSYETQGIIPLDSDMEIRVKVDPEYTSINNRGDFFVMLSDDENSGGNNDPDRNYSDIWTLLRPKPNFIYYENSNLGSGGLNDNWSLLNDNVANGNFTGSDMTEWEIIITYDESATEFRIFHRINGNYLVEAATSPLILDRTKTAVKLYCGQEYNPENETPRHPSYSILVDSVEIYDEIQTTEEDFVPMMVRESQFGETVGTYPIPVDLDQVWADGFPQDYNGIGQFVTTHGAAASGWPNARIDTVTTVTADCEIVLDITPGFTADGRGQMFNVIFGGVSTSAYIANFTGAGAGWGIFFNQANYNDLLPVTAAVPWIAADAATTVKLIFTYESSTMEHRLFWSVNGDTLRQHPQSPVITPRTGDATQFQWQVWDGANPSAFSVGLDNWAEYNYILTSSSTPVPVELTSFELD